MGNGAVKALPPTGVVTIVLAGGRVEEFKKPVVAGDIMLRHPRHHVVRPDFFRSSPMVVLRPEEVLMPGHKFLLVPFHTVYKRLSRKVEVLHRPSTSSSARPPSAASAAGGAYPSSASDQPGAIRGPSRSRPVSVGTQPSVKFGKRDSAGLVTARRSPAGRSPLVLRKISEPAASAHDRKTLRHRQMSRNSRKRRSGDNGDYTRMRVLLHSRVRRNSTRESAAEVTENKSMESSNLTNLQSFRTADFAKPNSIALLTTTKQASSSDLAVPDYESFQTSLRASRELRFRRRVSAVTEHGSFETMDFSELEKASIAPLLPTTATLVRRLALSFEATASYSSEKNSREQILPKTVTSIAEHESVEAMDSSEPKKSSSEPPLRMIRRASVLGVKERIDSLAHSRGDDLCLDHLTRLKQDLSRFNKTLRPLSSSMEGELNPQKTTIKMARTSSASVKKLVQSFEKNSLAQLILMPKTTTSVEEHESSNSSEPRQRSSITEPPLRMPAPPPTDGSPSAFGVKERMDSQGGDSGLHHQTRKEDLKLRFDKPLRPASSTEGELKEQKLTIEMAADSQQAMSRDARQDGSRQQVSTIGEKTVVSREQERSSSGRSEQPSEQRAPRPQQEIMDDQAGGLNGLQQVLRGAGNSKSEVKVLDRGPMFKSSQVASKPLMSAVPGKMSSVILFKPRKPHQRKLIEHLCLSSSRILQSPLHVRAAAGGSTERQRKANLKLIDHLQLEPSPPRSFVQKLYQQSPLRAHNTKVKKSASRHRFQSPMVQNAGASGRGSGSGLPKVRKDDVVALQLNQVIDFQLGASVLRPNGVEGIGVTPIEEKFLKLPPVSLFRNRRMRTTRRLHTTANWRPKLSPLVEFSP